MTQLSFIIPVYNEATNVIQLKEQIRQLQQRGHEVIIVDGGSSDQSVDHLRQICPQVIVAARGRARQMNAGAAQAGGQVLLFLHADTQIPQETLLQLEKLAHPSGWGRCNVRLSGGQFIFRIIETMMNWRSRLTGIATGDQCIFIGRKLFARVGGFADIPLMEDIAITTQLKTIQTPICLKMPVISSSRRWEVNGIVRTVLLMWLIRLAYYLGVSPQRLHRLYYPV